MLFRRNKPLQLELVPPPFEERAAYTAPNLPRQPARTLEEILGLAPNPAKPTANCPSSSSKGYRSASPTRAGHSAAQRPPRREPSSRKTGHVTIRTDATDIQGAFESDAFAVHIPTTRLPIIDQPASPIKTTRAAQIEAYRTYEEKARQIRQRSNSTGVQVPAKIISYDYAGSAAVDRNWPLGKVRDLPVSSPTPVGSFTISPPLPQSTWERSERRQAIYVPSLRTTEESSILQTPSKPLVSKTNMSPNMTGFRSRADSEAGASAPISTTTPSPTPQPNPIRVRVQTKPKRKAPVPERVQTESTYSLYNRPPASTSTTRSRSTSSVKSMPNFTRQNSVEGDSIFGYQSKDLAGTTAGASSSSPLSPTKSSSDKDAAKTKTKDKAKKEEGTKKERTRWHWLRPSGPRLAKPTTTPVVFSQPAPAAVKIARPVSTYVDPFTRLATPPPAPTALLHKTPAVLRPASPCKTLQPTSTPSEQHVSTGFIQLRSFGLIVLKVSFYLYALIAVWFVLDAVREAFHTIGLPFRFLMFLWGYVWVVVVWTWSVLVGLWARWEFKVALKGGWMWKMASG
jgi:hypothetical protein